MIEHSSSPREAVRHARTTPRLLGYPPPAGRTAVGDGILENAFQRTDRDRSHSSERPSTDAIRILVTVLLTARMSLRQFELHFWSDCLHAVSPAGKIAYSAIKHCGKGQLGGTNSFAVEPKHRTGAVIWLASQPK
jgi:hypothetical protein